MCQTRETVGWISRTSAGTRNPRNTALRVALNRWRRLEEAAKDQSSSVVCFLSPTPVLSAIWLDTGRSSSQRLRLKP